MTEDSEPQQARVEFKGDLLRKFLALKNYYGIENNVELVRLLVTLRYEELKKEGCL